METSRPLGQCQLVIGLLLVGSAVALGQQPSTLSLDELRQQRHELAHKPRRIIMNNDGCDVLYFPKDEPVSVDAFLAKRTTALAGTHVGAIAFCPTSSGFSHFTHNTAIGTVLTRSGYEFGLQPNTRNIAADLIRGGKDCLQAIVEFGHEHDMEVFWSMRMNDTHDVAHRPDHPYFLFPPLKATHPEWLVGNPVKRTPYGRWSSVDYAVAEIRDLAFKFIQEVCQNYGVDGVELDFFRHLCYFRETAYGDRATQAQAALMTELMRRVRTMTEAEGCKRRRPILIAVRVPDSLDYCREMGLDVEAWLREGLVDLLIPTGYFRLNPWKYSVELGHKYGVAVYPCLSDSRVRGESRFRRSSIESYRGRAMNAWAAGADGLHLFNFFNPQSAIWHEIGDPATLRDLDKLYFVTVRDGDPNSYLAGGVKHQSVPVFCPSRPRFVSAERPVTLPLLFGDDLQSRSSGGAEAQVRLHLEVPGIRSADQLMVAINGTRLAHGSVAGDWADFSVPRDALRQGSNDVSVGLAAEPEPMQAWGGRFDGAGEPGTPWQRDRGSERAYAESSDRGLHIVDRGELAGDYLYYRMPWGATAEGKAVVEASVQVRSGSSFVIVANGDSGERLGLWPDRIELFHHRSLHYPMDTTDQFHRYRMELDGHRLTVSVDGIVRIEAPDALEPRKGYSKSEVAFGAANSPMTGDATWARVRAGTGRILCRDLVLSVTRASP